MKKKNRIALIVLGVIVVLVIGGVVAVTTKAYLKAVENALEK